LPYLYVHEIWALQGALGGIDKHMKYETTSAVWLVMRTPSTAACLL